MFFFCYVAGFIYSFYPQIKVYDFIKLCIVSCFYCSFCRNTVIDKIIVQRFIMRNNKAFVSIAVKVNVPLERSTFYCGVFNFVFYVVYSIRISVDIFPACYGSRFIIRRNCIAYRNCIIQFGIFVNAAISRNFSAHSRNA